MGGWALLGVSEPASAQTSHSASHSTPLHTLPNPSLFMTTTTGLLSSNTCVCMQSLDFGAQHTQVVWACSSKQSQWEAILAGPITSHLTPNHSCTRTAELSKLTGCKIIDTQLLQFGPRPLGGQWVLQGLTVEGTLLTPTHPPSTHMYTYTHTRMHAHTRTHTHT